MSRSLDLLVAEIRACTRCAAELPAGPRPVVQVGGRASVLIIGQAPGRRVHASGVPWDDASGDRLRAWLGIDRATFYARDRVALVPMGFCYPGSGRSGDLPPRPECAPLWHERILAELPADRLTILLGAHALARYVPERAPTLTETVRRWRGFLPQRAVLPHPSPRNARWLRRNPWFKSEVLPELRARVAAALRSRGDA